MIPIRKTIKSIEHFVVHRILHIDDTPHRLALGIALGVFLAWTPTIGFQMALVLLLAPIIRANGRVGLPVVWISNPLTFAIIYYPNYLLGRLFLQGFGLNVSSDCTQEQLVDLLAKLKGFSNILQNFTEVAFWNELGQVLLHLGVELWVGSILAGIVLGGISYIISYRFINWYRTHTPRGRLYVLKMLRKKRQQLHDRKKKHTKAPQNGSG